jgi:hypothetical protein
MLAAMFMPLFLAVGVIAYSKRAEARDERRSPLKDKLLHQPGAHARRKAEEFGDDILARTLVLFMVGPLAIMAMLLPRVQWAAIAFGWTDWLLVAIALATVIWSIRDIVRYRRERRHWLNGMRGEMASAQALDRLRAHGYEVFHDLPGDRGNIDHVVVGHNAVFAVETKWRSKHGKGTASAEVWFDGQSLQFPGGFRDTAPVEQARACAADLSRYLAGRTGETVQAIPVVSLPGWYTKNRPEASSSDTVVINPKMASVLNNQPGSAIPNAQRNRIISAIAERYPELQD